MNSVVHISKIFDEKNTFYATQNISSIYDCLKIHLIKMTKILTIPSIEKPVNSAQIPKVPPKLAILSLNVVLASSTVISTSGLL